MEHNISELEGEGKEQQVNLGVISSSMFIKRRFNPKSLGWEILRTEFCLGGLMFPEVLVMGFTGFI